METETVVVNKRKEEFDVDISRPSKWGNPYHIGDPDPVTGIPMDRRTVIFRYRDYFPKTDLPRYLDELRGKRLGCWCKPKACHGDVLVELVHKMEIEKWF